MRARPQTGLGRADIVYVLPVEGGLTRFMAIFSSQFPPVIGPVRSAREDDLPLLRQFGHPAFAYSGAQPHLLPVVERAPVVDLYDGLVGGYYRDNHRVAPYNLYARTSQLLAEAHGASRAHDIGFRFGPAPSGGMPTAAMTVPYPAASFTFRWSAALHRWQVWMDGVPAMTTDGGQLSTPTVVVQYTTVGVSHFPEWGGPGPVRRQHRFRPCRGAAGREGVASALVPARRHRRDHIHHAVREADDIRTRAGVGAARRTLSAPAPSRAERPCPAAR